MLDEIKALHDHFTTDNLTEIIYNFFKVTDETGLLRVINTGEIELLYRKLPQEVIAILLATLWMVFLLGKFTRKIS